MAARVLKGEGGIGMARRILLAVTALALPVAVVTMVGVGTASAGGPSFSGPALGKVTCTGVNVKVSFSPPAKLTTGGTNVTLKGKMSGCTVSGAPTGVTEVIQQGKITGSSMGTGTGCAGLATPSTNVINATIVWKGKYNNGKAKFDNSVVTLKGTQAVTDGSGNSGFEVPNPSTTGSSVTGSFAGSNTGDESFLYSSQSTNAITTLCGAHGLKKLSLTHGTVIAP